MTHLVRRAGLSGLLGFALLGSLALAPAQADVATETYIVTTNGTEGNDRALDRLDEIGRKVKPTSTYARALRGFAAELTPTQVAALEADPSVADVEPSIQVHTTATQKLDQPGEWGLDRIDRRADPLNQSYDYPTTGAGVTVFELDTGIQLDHSQFGGRATSGRDFVDDDNDSSDCAEGSGHGTHVAGIIGGSTYGVAKQTKLVAVRILDCEGNGDLPWILDAFEWVIKNRPSGPAVINMSAAGPQSDALDEAAESAVKAGIPVIVSAGNAGESATHYSPANAADAITVGWTTRSDRMSADSNYGKRIDIFAPGDQILSSLASDTSKNRTGLKSGTSMAAPMVTGAVARYLQAYPKATPAQVRTALVGESTRNELSALGKNSPNRLLYLRRSNTNVPISVTANKSERLAKMRIRWQPPYGFGTTAVTSYVVTRSGTDAAGNAFAPKTVSASTRDFAWDGLRPGVRYTVSVAAVNSFGASTAVKLSDG